MNTKINNGAAKDDLPRLICASGRTDSAVACILDDVESRPIDVEFVGLLHTLHNLDIWTRMSRIHLIK